MKNSSINILNLIGFVIFTILFAGCATSTFQMLDQIHTSSMHQTEFVLVKHPSLKYFWEVQGEYGVSQIEIQEENIKNWGITYQKSQRNELELVEPYLSQFQDQSLITQNIFFTTLKKALTDQKFIQLKQYSGEVIVNNFKSKDIGNNYLSYDIPLGMHSTLPDWYLILEVEKIGLIKTGTVAGGGGLAGALSGVIKTAIRKDHWFAWFSGQIMIADAKSSMILWKSISFGSVKIDGKLEDLVEVKNNAFPKALIESIAFAAAKNTASLIKNEYVTELNENIVNYKLKPEELKPFIDKVLIWKSELTARAAHEIIYDITRNKAVLFGGHESYKQHVNYLKDTWEWDGKDWSQVSSSGPSARVYHAMEFDSTRGKVILFGGSEKSGKKLKDTWEWNGKSWVLVSKEEINNLYEIILKNGEIYKGTFLEFDQINGQRISNIIDLNNAVVKINCNDIVSQRELKGKYFRQIGPCARSGHAMAFDIRSCKIVLFGGENNENKLFDDTWEWDGENWSQINSQGPPARNFTDMAYDIGRKKTVLFGGVGKNNKFKDTWEWDGKNWLLASTKGPSARSNHTLTYDRSRRKIFLFGGLDEDGICLGDTWEWDGKDWTQVISSGPSARGNHAMCYDSENKKSIISGGERSDPNAGMLLLNDTWEWDGKIWIQCNQ